MASTSFKLDMADVGNMFKVALYVGASAALAKLAVMVGLVEPQTLAVFGIDGQVIATMLANVLIYTSKLLVQDNTV